MEPYNSHFLLRSQIQEACLRAKQEIKTRLGRFSANTGVPYNFSDKNEERVPQKKIPQHLIKALRHYRVNKCNFLHFAFVQIEGFIESQVVKFHKLVVV
jgi:hypothetical protein